MEEPVEKKLCVVCAEVYPGDLSTCPKDGTELLLAADGRDDGNVLGMVIGSYRLVREIGSGGVGTVWEAEHVRLGRKMALKILDPDTATDEVVQRFFNEARAVNEIRHPNIIEIEDFVSEGDTTYLLMEHLEGRDLRTAITEEERLSPARVLHIGSQVADALAAAAEVDIVHRDLKPDNIFLVEHEGDKDFAKLLDFGIAKFTKEQGVTQDGMTIGTPEYMAPEQITLEGEIDTRSDVYSLGVVLYEAVTGEPPFFGDSLTDVLRDHLNKAPEPPSKRLGAPLSQDLEAVILKCLEKRPSDRFSNMRALKEALDAAAATPKARDVLAPKRPQRRRRIWVLLAALAMAAVAALLYYAEDLGIPIGAPGAGATRDRSVPAPAKSEPGAATSGAQPTGAAAVRADAAPQGAREVLVLSSRPQGARIFVGAERDPAGFTPRELEVPASSEPLTLTAQFPDGTEMSQTVVPDHPRPQVVFVKPGWTPPDASMAGTSDAGALAPAAER